jgi:hypothetical protein
MEVKTSGRMDELVARIKGPTFSMDNVQTDLGELIQDVNHTMVVDPMLGEEFSG